MKLPLAAHHRFHLGISQRNFLVLQYLNDPDGFKGHSVTIFAFSELLILFR